MSYMLTSTSKGKEREIADKSCQEALNSKAKIRNPEVIVWITFSQSLFGYIMFGLLIKRYISVFCESRIYS